MPSGSVRASARREALAPVDAAWLRMDTPNNLMVITSLLVFDAPVEFSAIEALIRDRLLPHERFRQRVVSSKLLGVPHWELDPEFDLRGHLHRVALPDPGDQRALEDMVSDLMSTPLDHSKPLWQAHFIERADGGAALLVRLHHCIGDGVALTALLLTLTDEGGGATPPEVGVLPPHPERLVELAKQTREQAKTLGRLLFLPSDPKTLFKGELGTQKRAAWSGPIDLGTVKAAARAFGATVNDVLVSALTGALRSYLEEHAGWRDGLELRALVPVFVRGRAAEGDLGNHFGLVFLELPLGIADLKQRVGEVKRRMDAIKAQPDALVAIEVLAAMGVAASEIEHIGIDLFTRKATFMITNVPGPPEALHLAGRRLDSMMVWAPVSGHIGIGMSLLSYAGHVRLGVASDARRVSEPERIVQAFERELARLAARGREEC